MFRWFRLCEARSNLDFCGGDVCGLVFAVVMWVVFWDKECFFVVGDWLLLGTESFFENL